MKRLAIKTIVLVMPSRRFLAIGGVKHGNSGFSSTGWPPASRQPVCPVIHYLSVDEAIDCDSAHRKTLAGVRESRLWFSDVFTANRPAHDHFVFRRENIIDGRLAI